MASTITTRIEGGFDTGTVSAPLPAYTRVSQQTDGTYNASPATEIGDGVLDRLVTVAGDTNCRIHLRNAPGSKFGLVAGAAVATPGVTLYAAAAGAVTPTSPGTGAVIIGRSKTAAAVGGIVEYHSREII